MIFVTVGTHEQPFNRLVEEIDRLKGEGLIEDEVIIQKGYSTYTPKYCTSYDLISYDDMDKYNKEARIVITHGGPASFLAPITLGKTPIVVPRQLKFEEHVNDHQLEFANELAKRGFPLIVVNDIKDLIGKITFYKDGHASNIKSNNKLFVENLLSEIEKIF